MNIDELIQQAEELKVVNYSSPKIALWKKRTRSFIEENYGKEYVDILNRALFFGQVIMSETHGQQMHVQALEKAIELLDNLRTEPKIDKILRPKPEPLNDISPKLTFGQPGKSGHPGGGGSIFIQAQNFRMEGGGQITADGGDYNVQIVSTSGDKSPIQSVSGINYGNIDNSTAETVKNISELIKLIGESNLKSEEKLELIGDAETVKAQIIKPKPDKSILKKAWKSVQAASSIAGVIQLIQMVDAFVAPLIK